LRRMHLARRALFGADPTRTSVTRVVTDHVFWELGRFSVTYRTMFGESLPASMVLPVEPERISRADRFERAISV
jgi:hypothetical protein